MTGLISKKILKIVGIVLVVAILTFIGYKIYQNRTPQTNPTLNNPAGKNTIDIKGDGFSPKNYTVRAGTGVTWINTDTKDHSVTFKDFGSDKMQPQDIFTHMFDKKGIYPYYCVDHPKEKGSITVN